MAYFLLDTTALIDYMRRNREIIDLVNGLLRGGHQLGVCAINLAELYTGVGAEDRVDADRLVSQLNYFDITSDVAVEAGRYRYEFARQGITLSTTDAITAAVAMANGAILITANVRDFPMQELQLLQHG